jgi:NitT/TauT family transport system substrate-binding protein
VKNPSHVLARALVLCLLVALTGFVGACGGDDDSSSSNGAATTGDTTTSASSADNKVRVALIQAGTANLPFSVGDANGLFKKEGLDVKLVKSSIPFSQLPASLGKQFDIVLGSQPDLIKARAQGIDIVAISGLQKDDPKDPGAALVVKGDSDIKTIKDLKGKTVGAPSVVGNNWTALQCWAEKNGVGPKDFRGLEAPVPQLPDLLKQGRFDSILVFEPILGAAKAGGARMVGNAYSSCFGGPQYTSILLAQGDWAKSHPEQIKKFIAGMEAAKQSMADDPEAVRQLFIKTSGLPEVAAKNAPIIPHEFEFEQGDALVKNVGEWQDLMKKLAIFKGNIDPAEAVAAAD